jgi:hypothetical protein
MRRSKRILLDHPRQAGEWGLGQAERLSEISTGCEDLTASNYSYI